MRKTQLLCSLAVTALCFLGSVAAGSAQSPVLLDLRTADDAQRLVVDSSGAFVAYGLARDVGNTPGCAAQLQATGAGTRFMWIPCRGSVRFGRVPAGQTNWDDANIDDFTFAGGNRVTASDYGAFAYGDNVHVSSTVGVGFGSGVTVSGTAGFAAGAGNVCSGFACTVVGYENTAAGQGSVALGYRTIATGDYTTALGYRASTSGQYGAFVWGDGSTNDSVRSQAPNEFRIRASGGIRLRTSTAANAAAGVGGNTGCDLLTGSGTWSCSSSRTIKTDFSLIDKDWVLMALRDLPVSTWRYREDTTEALHLGPVAEDFYAAFGLGPDSMSLASQDLAGVALVATQALERRTTEQTYLTQSEIRSQAQQIRELRAEVEGMRALREEVESLREMVTEVESLRRRLREMEAIEERLLQIESIASSATVLQQGAP